MSKGRNSPFSIEGGSYLNIEQNDDDIFMLPERRLLFALLERAIRDFLSNRKIEQEDAAAWLNNLDDISVFSCPWACELLGIDQKKLIVKAEELRYVCKARDGGTREIYGMLADFDKFGLKQSVAA